MRGGCYFDGNTPIYRSHSRNPFNMRSSARLETIVVIEVSYEMGDGLQARLVEEVTIGIMV